MSQLVVLPGASGSKMGCQVSWKPQSAPIRYGALCLAIAARGLAESWYPRAPSAERVLARACTAYQDDRQSHSERVLARPVAKRGGAWILTHESVDRANVDASYSVAVRVWLDEDDKLTAEPMDDPRCAGIRAVYERVFAEETLDQAAVSTWLTDCVHRIGGLSLTHHGHMYFVPPSSIAEWDRVQAAAEEAGRGINRWPVAVCHADAVEWLVGRLTAETDAQLEAALARAEATLTASAKAPGERALATTTEALSGVESKLRLYEELLDVKLVEVQERLDTVQERLGEAKLAAAAKADQERKAKQAAKANAKRRAA